MKDKLTVRALLFLAVTNPLVWVLAVLLLSLAMCVLVVLAYWLLFEWAGNELASPGPSSRRTHGRVPDATVPADDGWPLLAPAPEFVAQLDEFGRVELLADERLDEQGAALPESHADTVTPSPRPAPAAARTTRNATKSQVSPATPTRDEAEQLPREELVRLARRAGAVAANRRWSRAKLVEAVVARK